MACPRSSCPSASALRRQVWRHLVATAIRREVAALARAMIQQQSKVGRRRLPRPCQWHRHRWPGGTSAMLQSRAQVRPWRPCVGARCGSASTVSRWSSARRSTRTLSGMDAALVHTRSGLLRRQLGVCGAGAAAGAPRAAASRRRAAVGRAARFTAIPAAAWCRPRARRLRSGPRPAAALHQLQVRQLWRARCPAAARSRLRAKWLQRATSSAGLAAAWCRRRARPGGCRAAAWRHPGVERLPPGRADKVAAPITTYRAARCLVLISQGPRLHATCRARRSGEPRRASLCGRARASCRPKPVAN
mmetsp:Transcript_34021/g.92114  ORF Transcript_34021/g.92114 Transcript_34021/m.92114 type:complete len:304 (+) Transcript_34021:175-1086(+)